MNLKELSDEALMSHYILGNTAAFNELYDRYRRKLYGYLRGSVSKKEIADEIFQSTFFNLHRSRHRYKPGLRVDAWIFSICRNAMRDFFRRRKTSERDLDAFDEETMSEAGIESEPEVEVQAQLDRLPPDQKAVVSQRLLEDREFAEIAKRLRTTPQNVRQLLSRGLKRLRKEFGSDKS